jgi:tetratricopeptide (TPR) repeat protein
VLLFAAAALFVFKFYGYVRAQSDAARALDLYEQGRLVEARRVLGGGLIFSPGARWRGMKLADVAARLDGAIAVVEQRASGPLAGDAAEAERLARARDLAMLERTDEALAVLDGSATVVADAAACNLRGMIYETRGAYAEARRWYAAAKEQWQERDDSTEKGAGLTVALKGVAYCERKRGRLIEAEAGYQELLRYAPTADMHFLVAQFYEDTQRAKRAEFHAREAVRLDPERYSERGRVLVDKLLTSHFGCWSISSEP